MSTKKIRGMILAATDDWVIGRTNGDIPWKHKGDQKLFKEKTMGCVVVMGRVTWEGIPDKYKPLSGRHNIVLTSRPESFLEDNPSFGQCEVLESALLEHNDSDIWFIGGARVYKESLKHCNVVHLTRVPDHVTGDDLVRVDIADELARDFSKIRFTHSYNKDLWIEEYTRRES